MTQRIEDLRTPAGTTGLAVEPWRDELFAVAANWQEASAPVYELIGDDEWRESRWQVADSAHCEIAALARHLEEQADIASEEAAALAAAATQIYHSEKEWG